MDHSYYQQRLSAYLDNELTPEETEALRCHLEECEECRTRLQNLKRLDEFAAEKADIPANDYFEMAARRIETRLEGQSETEITHIRQSPYRGLGWKVVAVAASVAVLTFIGLHRQDLYEMLATDGTDRAAELPAGRKQVAAPQLPPEPIQVDSVGAVAGDDAAAGERLSGEGLSPHRGESADEKMKEVTQDKTVDVSESAMPVGAEEAPVLSKGEGEAAGERVAVPSPVSTREPLTEQSRGGVHDEEREAPEELAGKAAVPPVEDVKVTPYDDLIRDAAKARALAESAEADRDGAERGQQDRKALSDEPGELSRFDLDGWRSRRDSLMAAYEQKNRRALSDSARSMIFLKGKVTGIDEERQRLERQFLEAVFAVGKLTESDTERAECITDLEMYVESRGPFHEDLARYYLKELRKLVR
jgi:hypothetical protein